MCLWEVAKRELEKETDVNRGKGGQKKKVHYVFDNF
jgi:hypothetical protein